MLGQSGPGSSGNEEVLCIPQSPCLTGTSPSDCLVSYPGHSLGGGSQCILQPQLTGQYKVKFQTVLFQIIQFSISTHFKCQNSSILSNSV